MTKQSLLNLLLVCISIFSVAQNPGDQDGLYTNPADSLFNKEWEQDSTDGEFVDKAAYWVTMENPSDTSFYRDTTLEVDYAQYDILKRNNPFRQNLGYLGSQSTSYVFSNNKPLTFSYGNEQYYNYYKRIETLRLIKSASAFSDLSFSQASQRDLNMQGIFSKTYRNTTLFIDYHRIAHKPEDPFNINTNAVHEYSATELDALQLTFAYLPEKGRYHGIFSYIFNQTLQNDTGGYLRSSTQDSLLQAGPDAADNFLLATNLANANNRNTTFTFDYLHELKLGADSSASVNRVSHRISFQRQTNVHFNTDLSSDSTYYQDLNTDLRGVRVYFSSNQLDNTFTLKRLGKKNPLNKYEVGLRHQFISYDFEAFQEQENHVWLFGKFNTLWKDRFNVNADATFGVIGNRASTYAINGTINWRVLGDLSVTGYFKQQLRAPSLLENRFVNTFTNVWNNDWQNEFSTTFAFQVTNPKTKSTLKLSTRNILNYIYFDETQRPQQTTSAQNILQIEASQKLRFLRNVRLDVDAFFQTFSNADLIPLPTFGINADLYYHNRIIKKRLEIQLGVNLLLMDSFSPYGFNVASEQFYIQNDYENPIYPNLGAFLNVKRGSFRGFVNVGNILTFNTTDVFQDTDKYLLRDFYLRFGIAWRLYQ